jgi:hypothetical protein
VLQLITGCARNNARALWLRPIEAAPERLDVQLIEIQ